MASLTGKRKAAHIMATPAEQRAAELQDMTEAEQELAEAVRRGHLREQTYKLACNAFLFQRTHTAQHGEDGDDDSTDDGAVVDVHGNRVDYHSDVEDDAEDSPVLSVHRYSPTSPAYDPCDMSPPTSPKSPFRATH